MNGNQTGLIDGTDNHKLAPSPANLCPLLTPEQLARATCATSNQLSVAILKTHIRNEDAQMGRSMALIT